MFRPIRRIEKKWGHELWLHNSPLYCGKVLVVKPGCRTSYHYHEEKHETFAVLDGRALIYIGERSETFGMVGEWHTLEAGSVIEIQPYQVHAIAPQGSCTLRLLEISTQHLDGDSHRLTEASRDE